MITPFLIRLKRYYYYNVIQDYLQCLVQNKGSDAKIGEKKI